MSALRVRWLDAAGVTARMDALARLLADTVADGASVGFIAPFGLDEATAFWRDGVVPEVASGARALAVAETEAGALLGTVQLLLGTPANQAHRAEVMKLMVARAARRQGVARALMAEAETRARLAGRTLLTLDTRTDSEAEPLYLSLGFTRVGVIPDYCRHPQEDRLEPTTYFYRRLAPPAAG